MHEDLANGLGLAAVILAICLGLSTCGYTQAVISHMPPLQPCGAKP
ncbi:hypothetical protein MKK88_22070 [Methylobacterium sp. E-005]|nr:hypothetical protein [Methylobacterium sp. E-005]MCJ2088643.1 hypothetical protein [Methylobacterium sp. E-005]